MNIFFVTSFGSIYDRVIPTIEQHKDELNIVVPTTDDMYRFFSKYTDYTLLKTDIHPDLLKREDSIFTILKNIKRSKQEYEERFSTFKNFNVYFFGYSCAINIYSYLQKLSKKNKLICILSNKEIKNWEIKNDIKSKSMNLFIKIFLGIDTEIMTVGKNYFFQLSPKFFDKNNVEIIKVPSHTKPKLTIDIMKDKNIFVELSDSRNFGYNPEKFVDTANTIIKVLNKQFNYAIKAHPLMPWLPENIKKGSELPSFIPAEFVLSDKLQYVIGIESYTLIRAKNLTNAKVISLINLFEFDDKNRKQIIIDWLKKESDNIIFPKTFEEFVSVIS